jgi:hypothetical protein
MSCSAEQTERILAEQEILHSGETNDVSLCRYKNVSCVRCCLPHIGGDSHLEDPRKERTALLKRSNLAAGYLGPGNIVMKFKNFNPLKDPKIEASQYEDSFQDVGREEMEKRFSERRALFLDIYDREQPRQSLPWYMKAAQRNEGYKYEHTASSGLASLFLGGSVPTRHIQKGELPECQLLGFVDGKRLVGCLAHPLAETSQGYDGRDQVGFFHHTGCCRNIGCEASKEFKFLSVPAMKIFDKAIEGMSWYEYSRHAISVLVYYLRSYDHIFQKLDEGELLDLLTLKQLVELTNTLHDEWPMKEPDRGIRHSGCVNSLDMLSTDIPLSERMMYIALDAWFLQDHFAAHLQQARDHIESRIKAFRSGMPVRVRARIRCRDRKSGISCRRTMLHG